MELGPDKSSRRKKAAVRITEEELAGASAPARAASPGSGGRTKNESPKAAAPSSSTQADKTKAEKSKRPKLKKLKDLKPDAAGGEAPQGGGAAAPAAAGGGAAAAAGGGDDDDLGPPPDDDGGGGEGDQNDDGGDEEQGNGGVAFRDRKTDGGGKRRQRNALALGPLSGNKSVGSTTSGKASSSSDGRSKSSKNIKSKMKNTLAALSVSRFEKWSKEELIMRLIADDIEVRAEATIQHSTLVGLIEALYQGKDMPPKVPPYSQADLDKITPVILKIQNAFIERSAMLRGEEERHTMFERDHDLEDISAAYTDLDLNAALLDDDDDEQEPYDLEDGREGSKHWFANPIKVVKAGRTYERMRVDGKIGGDGGGGDDFRESEFDGGLLGEPRDRSKQRSRAVRILDIPWHAPSWSKAEDHMNYNRPRQGGKGGEKFHFRSTTTGRHCPLGGCGEMCDLFREGQVSEFGIFGPGVTNYFKFTKWLFWLFFVLSILSLPELMLNLLGPYHAGGLGLTDISSTTVGNLAPRNLNQTVSIEMPLCPYARAVAYDFYGTDFNCNVSRQNIGIFFAGFDMLICLVVLLAFVWVRIYEKREELMLDKNTVFASMYTLQFKNLPETCDEHKLKHHLLKVMHSQDRAIASINMAVDNYDEFQKCVQRGELIKERTRLINLHRYETTRIRARPCRDEKARKSAEAEIKSKRKVFVEKCKTVDTKLREIDGVLKAAAATRPSCKPIVAFVTFSTIHDLEKCMFAFGVKKGALAKLIGMGGQASNAKLLEGKSLRISRAPEPSTIIWENLRFTFKERIMRRNFTTLLALFLIVISVVCTYVAKILQDRSNSAAGTTLCPTGFNSLPQSTQVAAVNSDSSILHCYCDNLSYSQQATDKTCREYYKQQVSMELVTYFASVVVLLINVGVEFIMQAFSELEKHQSEDTAYRSVFLRLFALKYINTSCVFLINSNIQWLAQIFGSKGNSVEFSGDWYRTVGVSIVLVQLGSIILAHSKKLWDYFRYKRLLRLARKRQDTDRPTVLTQDELNKLHEGPVFEFSNNYAQLMTTFFVCMTFSAGMPVLYIIGMLNFGFTYLVDKYLFINLYKSPNRYSTKIGREATGLVPWAVVLHLFMGIWALSNATIFAPTPSSEAQTLLSQKGFEGYKQSIKPGAQSESQALSTNVLAYKFYSEHTFPLFLLAAFVVLLRFIYWLLDQLGYATGRFFGRIYDHGDGEVPHDSVAYAVTYARAVQRNLIKSESSPLLTMPIAPPLL